MAKTVEILHGYQGRVTGEYFLPAGAVIEVDDQVAKELMANGHAKASKDEATFGLKGPLSEVAAPVKVQAPVKAAKGKAE